MANNTNNFGILTSGLDAPSNSSGSLSGSLITGGMPATPSPLAPETLTQLADSYNSSSNTPTNATIPSNSYSPPGGALSSADPLNLGTNTPYLNPSGALSSNLSSTGITFSGSDIRGLLEIPAQNGNNRIFKELVELTTISISIHRAKSPVRALGYINPKGYSRSGRTVAGTMVFTKFDSDVLERFLKDAIITDISQDSQYKKVDQLPPFNLTLMFANEFGYISYQRLLGIDFLTDGSVYSSSDMFSESTMSYVASDFTPMLPYTSSSMNMTSPSNINPNSPGSSPNPPKTIQDCWNQNASPILSI